MNLLDLQTVILSYAISNFICIIVIAVLWHQNRHQYKGPGYWLADFVMQWSAIVLIGLRGKVPNFFSVTISNAMLIGGTILMYMGLERFVGKRRSQVHNFILLAAFIISHSYFTFFVPSQAARTILLSLGLLIICSQCAWLLLHSVDRETASTTAGVGFVFILICLASVFWFAVALADPAQNNFYQPGINNTISVLTYQMLLIVLTFFLFIMVNHRLVVKLNQDITDRKQIEETLRVSEEKFFRAFHSSPDAILITRLTDGMLVEVNESFCRIFGWMRKEVISSSTLKLGMWVNRQEREQLFTELRENQSVFNREYEFRNKAGQIVNGLYSGEYIFLEGQAHILSTIRDTSEQKLSERLTRLRLELWEYSSEQPLDKLAQKALDEIGELTGSPIGFYHFVEEDQNTLTLTAWSTRTKAEFCRAEGEGLHHPIDQAGVWVDCVHQRKPVIHNDYAALPRRKGMPVGHAQVVRELVVPTMRSGKVVAILGVGNKPTDYDDGDVKLVFYIADVIWTIVEQKRAGEKIRLLNAKLEQMAMTDELTGLENRRSFFKRGGEEVKRSRRYHTPLSLLMVDIDNFKNVNDTYGHDVGDLILQCVAHTLKSSIREIDILARLGGEEFGIVLPNTSPEYAAQLGERLRLAVQSAACSNQNEDPSITVSIGVASYSQDTLTLDTMMRIADRAMYQAKSQGRNRVVYLE